jgi:broad specificity phosphatase PhoE
LLIEQFKDHLVKASFYTRTSKHLTSCSHSSEGKTHTMEIILIRHGKPTIPSLDKLTASAFAQWVDEYNAAGLSPSSTPTESTRVCTQHCSAIVCSALPRSIESAKALNAEKIVMSDALFNEAGLPTANWQRIKLSPLIWAVFFRVLWLFGYAKDTESFKETKARAIKATKRLTALVHQHEKVVFVGHGVFNRLLANELRKQGWTGAKHPGTKHWSTDRYKG